MRLFFDANVITYIALFEGYLVEGTDESLDDCCDYWQRLQGGRPDAELLREVRALRILYLYDEAAHFDWLFSEVALKEILQIKNQQKRRFHYDLLERLIEHRQIVYGEGQIEAHNKAFDWLLSSIFPNLPAGMYNDALQFCEALYVESYYFISNDIQFNNKANSTRQPLVAVRPSELPFVAGLL